MLIGLLSVVLSPCNLLKVSAECTHALSVTFMLFELMLVYHYMKREPYQSFVPNLSCYWLCLSWTVVDDGI